MSGVTEVKITDVKAICTAPEGIRLVVVKVETSEPGLGIDIDERLAAKHPFPEDTLGGSWPPVRRLDGTVTHP